jgi:cytochrome c oxidase subunit 2
MRDTDNAVSGAGGEMSLLRRPHRRVASVLGLVAALVLAFGLPHVAAAQSPAPFDPASTNNELIRRLYDILFWSSGVIFLLVEGLLIYSVVKFGRKSPDEMPVQIHGNTQVEIAWTIAPAFLLVVITFLSYRTMLTTSYLPSQPDLVIEGVGRQFSWVFTYPEHGITTNNEFYIPLGKTVEIQLSSDAVQHAFWIPQLGGKTDLIPGRVTKHWFKASREGTFKGQCAELCGVGHAQMLMEAHVLQPEEYEAWVASQTGGGAAAELPTDPIELGKVLYTQQGCSGCHALSDLGAAGAVGPTHETMGTVAAERIADPSYTGTATSPEEYIHESIVEPAKYLAPPYTNLMPSFAQLSEEHINALVALLSAQK